jgi:TolA-binding protein
MSRKTIFKNATKTLTLSTVFGTALFGQTVWAQQDTEEIVNNLIALRGQVEDLQAEMQILKAEHTQSMTYLNTRKTELEANIDRKQLQIKQSQAEIVELQEKIKSLGLDSEQMIPDVLQLANNIEQAITTGIPFKPTERKSVIEDIVRDLQGRKITSQHAINRLWAFLEDEMRLARENAIYSQTIELNGEQMLVDVAKLGTVLMYFKTRDDKYGQAVNNNGWQFKLFDDEKDSQAVANLFDSLKKQIRQGYFNLPLTLEQG